MHPDHAIEVDHVTKRLRIGAGAQYATLRDLLSGGWRQSDQSDPDRELIALNDASFTVRKGQMVGLVGHNGAGKSTTLKLLSSITRPTSGEIRIRGKIGSLLEVGTGFHAELSGRENIFLNGAILGMSKQEITDRLDEIVEFSEVGRFLDTPVKHYSTGMYMRLAFAVAAHLEPEILLVDEVLSVGDAAFQKKCLEKMGSVSSSGRTIVFVSHNLGAVRKLCDSVIVLEKGNVIFDGDTDEGLSHYIKSQAGSADDSTIWRNHDPIVDDKLTIRGVHLTGDSSDPQTQFAVHEPINVHIEVEAPVDIDSGRIVCQIQTGDGQIAFTSFEDSNFDIGARITKGSHAYTCRIPGDLLNTESYIVHVSAEARFAGVQHPDTPTIRFDMVETQEANNRFKLPQGVVRPQLEWTRKEI